MFSIVGTLAVLGGMAADLVRCFFLLFSLVLGGKKSLKSYMQCAYDRGLRSHEESSSATDVLFFELRVCSGSEERILRIGRNVA